MTFPEDVVNDAWELVEGKCECSRQAHQHPEGRCNKHLMQESRAKWGGEVGRPAQSMGMLVITPSPTARSCVSIAVPGPKANYRPRESGNRT